MSLRSCSRVMFFVLAWSLWQPAYAILEIEITKGVEKGMPIAVVPFKMPAGPIPHDVSAIIGGLQAFL